MKNNEKKFGFWYFYIHSKLREKASKNLISIDEAKSFLFEWRLPKYARTIVLKELENMELVEIIDKNTIRIKDSDFPIENISKLYEIAGII